MVSDRYITDTPPELEAALKKYTVQRGIFRGMKRAASGFLQVPGPAETETDVILPLRGANLSLQKMTTCFTNFKTNSVATHMARTLTTL
jgi:hypothetical protein